MDLLEQVKIFKFASFLITYFKIPNNIYELNN